MMVCSAFGMAHRPSLLRVTEISALHVQPQKQNEEKMTLKTLKDTEEVLIHFNFTWKITHCLLSSLSTEMWLPQRKSGKGAQCRGT